MRTGTFRFLALFALLYVVFETLYFQVPDKFLRDVVYHHGIVSVSVNLIDAMAPAEGVSAVANRLASPRAVLEIVRGCDGSGTLFLVWAAVLAYGATVRHRILGVIAGTLLIYAINQVRIVGLYFVVAYHKSWFLPIHTYLAPTLIVVICGIFFAVWAAPLRSAEKGGRALAA